jgi:hypothetical protein
MKFCFSWTFSLLFLGEFLGFNPSEETENGGRPCRPVLSGCGTHPHRFGHYSCIAARQVLVGSPAMPEPILGVLHRWTVGCFSGMCLALFFIGGFVSSNVVLNL